MQKRPPSLVLNFRARIEDKPHVEHELQARRLARDEVAGGAHVVDIPSEITYLNCCYMSPQMLSVSEAGRQALFRKQHPWKVTIPDFFEVGSNKWIFSHWNLHINVIIK